MCLAVSVCINTTFCAPPCTTHDCHHFPGLKTWFWYVPFWTHLTLTLNSDVLASYTSSKRSKTGKIHPKIRYNPKIRCKHVRICVVETYMFRGGMSRQVCHLRAQTCVLTSCFTCCQSSVGHLLPAKTDIRFATFALFKGCHKFRHLCFWTSKLHHV